MKSEPRSSEARVYKTQRVLYSGRFLKSGHPRFRRNLGEISALLKFPLIPVTDRNEGSTCGKFAASGANRVQKWTLFAGDFAIAKSPPPYTNKNNPEIRLQTNL